MSAEIMDLLVAFVPVFTDGDRAAGPMRVRFKSEALTPARRFPHSWRSRGAPTWVRFMSPARTGY